LISKPMKTILHALSYSDMELESARRLADLKKLDPIRIFCRKLDAEIYNGDYKIPIRLYFPSEKAMEESSRSEAESSKLSGETSEDSTKDPAGKASGGILLFFPRRRLGDGER